MIRVAEPLTTSKFVDADFDRDTILNTNVSVAQVKSRLSEVVKNNAGKRKSSNAKAQRASKY